MRRRILITLVGILSLIVLAVATLPLWFGVLLGTAAPRFALRFRDYERIGYGRFALREVEYRDAGVHARADRVEASVPTTWLWQRFRGNGAELVIGKWQVEVDPARAGSKPKPAEDPSAPSGWVPVRNQIRNMVAQVEPWVRRATLGAGTVRWPDGEAKLAGIRWQDRALTIDQLAFQERVIDARVTVPADRDELTFAVRTATDEARIEVASRGTALTGDVAWWGQPARMSAQFPARGWMPVRAELSAANWDLPAEKLKLGEHYTAVHGNVQIAWADQRFTFDINANSTPRETEKAPPPLDVQLRGNGDLQSITLEHLRAQIPGATAQLSAPVTIARTGEIRDAPARFTTEIDLVRLPWIKATGQISGEVEAVSRGPGTATPVVAFRFEARDVSTEGVSASSVTTRGRFDWPRVDLEEATVVGTHGERLQAKGGVDLKAKEALGVSLAGELRHETFARWLPENIKFATVTLDATANGPFTQLQHRGAMRVTEVAAANLKPLEVALEWNGVGQAAERVDARITAGESRLSFIAAAGTESVRLTALEFAPRGVAPVRLTRPATLRWKPSLQLEGLDLRGETSAINASAAYGESGHVAIALHNIPSTWFADFVALPEPGWTLTSAAINGRWNRGPLEFEAVVDASVALREKQNVAANVHLRGDAKGVRLLALRALEGGAPVISASGRAPVVITPAGSPALRFDPEGELALNATTTENEAIWKQISDLAGVTIKAPRLAANFSGTWREPKGELRCRIDRVAFAPKGDSKPAPPLENLELVIKGDRHGVALERLAVDVEKQTVRMDGRLPFPKNEWTELKKDPLAYVRRGAEMRLELPRTKIAELKHLLPPTVVPQGTVEANIAYRDGGLHGSFQLHDAATRPIGTLGALHEIEASVKFDGMVVRLESASAHLGGEPVRISGTVALPPLGPDGRPQTKALPKFDVAVKATNIPLVRQVGTLVRADLDLALDSPTDAAPLLRGSVRLRNSLFLQDVRGLIPKGTRSKSERPPFFAVEADPFSQWRLDVRVFGEGFMRVQTTLFTGAASADFKLGGTLGEPTLLGEATLDRGNIRFPFATFAVQEGRVELTPAQPHELQVSLTATARRYEYDLRMEVNGEASSPVVTFESTPPLERAQVLLMVTAGVVPKNTNAMTQGKRATGLGAYLGSSLLSSFGDGDDTSRLTITSGEDISEQGRETYEIEYALNKRWSLTAEYPDEYDTQSLGVKWLALTRGGPRLASSGSESFDSGGGSRAGPDSETTKGEGDASKKPKKPKPAKLDVDGLGWFSNLEMEASLRRLLGRGRGTSLGPQAVEDAVFLTLSALREEGYLRPTARVHLVNTDGTRREFSIDADLATPVPRDVAAHTAQLKVERGKHYFVKELEFSGLRTVDRETARAFFVADPGLFKRQKALTFTPDRLKRGVSSLEAALRERGYAEAKVTAAEPLIDHDTGEVELTINVTEGGHWQISNLNVSGAAEDVGATQELSRYVGKSWSTSVEQDIAAEVRKNHLLKGYPDARVRVARRTLPVGDGGSVVELVANVTSGPRVTIGDVRFQGDPKTRDRTLERRVTFKSGDPLNLLAIQQARHRIARLGIFDDVDVNMEPTDGAVRDVVFDLKPGKRLVLNLLAGYNTYEQLRAGVEARQYNLWGRAHQARTLLVQSMKSTRGEYSYTVPELFGENINGTARLFGLQREEVAFLRQEYGARFNADMPVRFLDANFTTGYTFEVLRNSDNELESRVSDQSQIAVASIDAGLTRDKRDNPLLPRDGYRWYGRVEVANQVFGGRAEYQRFEMGAAYHRPWGKGRWLHFGAAHGVVTTFGRDDRQLPVNKRFFPGGDGSNRGYGLGEASPRGPDGRFTGAKSYLSATAEFEQALAGKLSGVVFVDALGSAQRLSEYPFDDVLVAIGLGLRYQTLIGPVRIEYGHNLNRRPGDPSGTFLLSIGFPF